MTKMVPGTASMTYGPCCTDVELALVLEADAPSRVWLGEQAPISATVLLVEDDALVRAVLISGTDMEEPVLDTGDRFLRKPFDVDALTRAVSELIAGQDGS